jgi:hypothetical protein
MQDKKAHILFSVFGSVLAVVFFMAAVPGGSAAQNSGQTIAKSLGAIKAITGSSITLAPESGPQITADVQSNARILRLNPGDKDPKNATPITLQDLQVGDTVRVRGYASADGKSITTLEVIVITKAAVSAVGDQMRQDWQKRGIGGLISAVDPANGTVTISSTTLSGKKTIAIHTTKNTVIRRYAADSIKYEDATPSTFASIQVGDQLRARGDRNADGTEFTAEEIVAGTFPFIVGTVKSVDASTGTLSVQDILSKKVVDVKVSAQSQLHKIPAEMAQRFAARLKGGMPPGTPGAGASAGSGANGGSNSGLTPPPAGNGQATQTTQGAPSGGAPAGAGGGARPGGGFDLQQALSRLPSSTLADLQLQKGDAVVILATQGSTGGASTAITLLSGVEPILQAAPNASQAMMLTPWSLGGAPGGDAGSQ